MSTQFQVNTTRLEAQAGLRSIYIQSDRIGWGPTVLQQVQAHISNIQINLNGLAICWGTAASVGVNYRKNLT